MKNASLSQPPSPPSHQQNRRKRSIDDVEFTETNRRPFSIRSDPLNPFAAPRVFTPLCLLPRSQLPLADLDTPKGGSRLFSANINILESAHDVEQEPRLLIVEEEQAKRFYAIERVKWRTYALCRLGIWVSRQQLENSAKMALCHRATPKKRRAILTGLQQQPWWKAASVQVPDRMADTMGGSAPTESPSLSMKLESTLTENELTGKLTTENSQSSPCDSGFGRFSTQDTLQELAKHYLDTLYLSRTSLAYFTKGPLSRARAAFTRQSSSKSRPTELINFLRESILTASLMDKKYKEGIASVIKELPAVGLEKSEQASKSKKKQKWKPKRDKAGFFMYERERLETWWTAQNDTDAIAGSGESVDATLKRRLSRLRSRETYMQIILALEVLALETAFPTQMDNAVVIQAGSNDSQVQQCASANLQPQKVENVITTEKQKAKKIRDLPALLEMLADRLCIWHSLDSLSPSKIGANSETRSDAGNDDLKDFCVEVILPFYMSRIPLHASTVNKKLGGPKPPSPLKDRSTSSRKPGEPAPRPASAKSLRKRLSRVSSEPSNEDLKPVPGLPRSASEMNAPLQHIKREDNEAPIALSFISPAKVSRVRKPRTNLLQSIPGLGRREIDLSATSRANEIKLRNKAEMDHKLKEAISALKKPNRALATKEVAESADASFAKSLVRSKSGGTQKNKAERQQRIRVAATPKHNKAGKINLEPCVEISRSENETKSPSNLYLPSSSAQLDQQHHFLEIPSSSFAVPQTGHRPRQGNAAGVEETPSKKFATFVPPEFPHSPEKLNSPIITRHTAGMEQTPSRSIQNLSLTPVTISTRPPNATFPNLLLTKCKKDAISLDKIQVQSKNIYDALGWNDDYEQLT